MDLRPGRLRERSFQAVATVIGPAPIAPGPLPHGCEIAMRLAVAADPGASVHRSPAVAGDPAVSGPPADGFGRLLPVFQEVPRPDRLGVEHDGIVIGIFAECSPLADPLRIAGEGIFGINCRWHRCSGKKKSKDHKPSGSLRPARRCAATNVLRISMAMVIGPTPPGTGVIAAATSTASS